MYDTMRSNCFDTSRSSSKVARWNCSKIIVSISFGNCVIDFTSDSHPVFVNCSTVTGPARLCVLEALFRNPDVSGCGIVVSFVDFATGAFIFSDFCTAAVCSFDFFFQHKCCLSKKSVHMVFFIVNQLS